MRRAIITLSIALLVGGAGGCTTLPSNGAEPAVARGPCTQPPFVFEEVTNLGPVVNSRFHEGSPCISADGLTLYFDSLRPGGFGHWDIWVTRRKNVQAPWQEPEPLGPPINTRQGESGPCLSADGLSLYFASDRPGGLGDFDIYVATRRSRRDSWGEPTNLGPAVNGPAYDNHPSISADGRTLLFTSRRPSLIDWWRSQDLYVARRPSREDAWEACVNLGARINTPNYEYSADLLPDGLTLFFDSFTRSRDLWMAARVSGGEGWAPAQRLEPPMNTPYTDTDPSMWTEGCTMYFASTRPGGSGGCDIWQAAVTCADSGEN